MREKNINFLIKKMREKMEEKNKEKFHINLQNNVIEIYKTLKNDKEKSQFLLKIFKFLIENDENFEVNDKIKFAFLGIKPSLKLIKNGGGNNNPNGYNQHSNKVKGEDKVNENNEVKGEDNEKIDDRSNKVEDKKYKEKKNEVEVEEKKEKEKEKEKLDDFITYEFCKQIYKKANCYDFDLVKFFNYYKDKGIKKEQVEHLMNQWDMRENSFKQQSKPIQPQKKEKLDIDALFRQFGVDEETIQSSKKGVKNV
jgi:hypothetical protein